MSPAAGAVSAQFVFTVTYRDTGNCAPNIVVLNVPGVGWYAMTGATVDYDGGVVFSRSLAVSAAGTYHYSFHASSGFNSGLKSVTLLGVTPSTFQVTAAPPPPTPGPTPPPTARPTPIPTPPPTARPTPRPTVPPTVPPTPPPTAMPTPPTAASSPPGHVVAPSATAPASTSPTASSMASPTQHGGVTATATPAPPIHDSIGPGIGGAATEPGTGGPVRFGTWAAVTAGGLGLFLLLVRRPRSDEPHDAAPLPLVVPADAASGALPPHGAAATADGPSVEANMPRWLRPSVQAARRRSLRD